MYIYDETNNSYIYFNTYDNLAIAIISKEGIEKYIAYLNRTRQRFTPAMTQLYDAFMAGHELRVL